MFNGIIINKGKISKIINSKKETILFIKTNMTFKKNEIGSSIACSGACLTLESYKKNIARFFLSKETLSRTNFKYIKNNDVINLEKSLIYGQRISGHYVQGHVDTISTIKNIRIIGKSWEVYFSLQKKFRKFIINKGSITINGVSLTVAKVTTNTFMISIIPKTLKLTNLINLKKHDVVNVEFDVLGKYIKNFMHK
jgi:riboflavin synthase